MLDIELIYYDPQGSILVKSTSDPEITIGSDPRCTIPLPHLSGFHCHAYRVEGGGWYANDLGGGQVIDGQAGSGYLRNDSILQVGGRYSFRVQLVERSTRPSKAPQRGRLSQPAAPIRRTRSGWNHRPGLALALSILWPGAGQAYNGRPVRGLFVLLFSWLILPWILGIVGAWKTACNIESSGGRVGRGGLLWVFFHGWLTINLAGLVLIGLTLAGVLA